MLLIYFRLQQHCNRPKGLSTIAYQQNDRTMDITFEQLPKAFTQLFYKLENIEKLLLSSNNSHQTENDQWFDLKGLCEYLPDKPVKPTVYGWVHLSIIPYHKRGKKLFFLKSEIDNWLKEGRKKTIAEIAREADNYLSNRKK